jgi:CheY-like chemotaxis protein
LVDGDTRSRRVLEVSLRKAGFSVTTAENLEQALLVLQHGEPDLIISDTRLQPEHDGFEFCLEVKKNPKWSGIPFVFLTSAKAIEDKVRGLELGVEDYLVKPIYIKEVTTRLRMLVQRKQRERLEKKDAARTKFTGHLADMAVVDLFQTIEISRKSGTIVFETELGEATIWFRDGSIIDAEMGRLQAEQAVYRLLGLNDGSFAVEFKPITRSATIGESTQGLLMEGMRRVDEWGRLLEQLPPLDAVLAVDKNALAELPEGMVSPELQVVLRRFDGRRTILGVVDETGKDDLEALEAISSLFFMGLLAASTEDLDEETVELGDSHTALRLEAWDSPAANQPELYVPPKVTPESGPHAIPSEVPPMPSFPAIGEPLAGDSTTGLVAGLPDETPSLGEGLTPLHDPRTSMLRAEESDPMMRQLSRNFASMSASDSQESPLARDDDDNPAFSQLGRTLKAIVEAEDEDDALALTEPVIAEDPGRSGSAPVLAPADASTEFAAARRRAEQEEAARRRAEDELARRDAERTPLPIPEIASLAIPEFASLDLRVPAKSPLDVRREAAVRERSRSLTEPAFVAPRPAPVVVAEDDDDDASTSGSVRASVDPSAAKTVAEPIVSLGEDTPGKSPAADSGSLPGAPKLPDASASGSMSGGASISASGSGSMSATPSEPRRLASPAPRTEPTWARPPTLQELGLDFGKKPAAPTLPTFTPPGKPDAGKPEPVKPEPVKPVASKPEPSKPEPVASKPESTRPELVKPEPVVFAPEPIKPEPVKPPEPVAFKPEPIKPKPESDVITLPPRSKDSSLSPSTSGSIGVSAVQRDDDEFAPVAVKVAEPARESLPPEPSRAEPLLPPARPTAIPVPPDDDDDDVPVTSSRPVSAPIVRDDVEPPANQGGSKIGLWLGIGIVAATIVGVVIFKDAIFGGEPKADDPKAQKGGKSSGEPTPSDEGGDDKAEVGATTGAPTPSSTSTTSTSGAAEGGEPSETASTTTTTTAEPAETGTTETGAPALDIETELASAQRYFTKFRRKDEAKAIIDKILEVDPDHGPTLVLRAQVLIEEGNIDDALATARRAKLSNPDDPELYPILAALLEAKNDTAGAIEAYQRYLELAPAGTYVSVAKSSIKRLEKTLK